MPTRTGPGHHRKRPAGLAWLPSTLGRVLDALLPRLCPACGIQVGGEGGLCPSCWEGMGFIAPPQCHRCGTPFALSTTGTIPAPAEALCGSCHRDPPPWDRARAVLRYDTASRGMILAFKHHDRTDAAPFFVRMMAAAGGALLAEADMIAPVPLHRRRLFARRYNQAALLASGLARHAGCGFVPDLLLRRRATPPQGRLRRRQRLANVAGAFMLNPVHAGIVEGRRVLLVDDVMTTGATLRACGRVLQRAGADVDVLTLAMVPIGEE